MISSSQKQILLGGLLGDSSFSLKNNFIHFSHSEKQKDYLEWKHSFFDESQVTKIKEQYHVWNNKKYLAYRFDFKNIKSRDDEFFYFINNNLYSRNGRKKISLKYLNELNSLGLAIWWLDDGSLCVNDRNRYGILCTHCFNYEENILIKNYFKNKWDIDVIIRKEKDKYYFIRFNATALKKLITIIYKHVTQIPSMIYKIDLKYEYKCRLHEFEDVYTYINSCK